MTHFISILKVSFFAVLAVFAALSSVPARADDSLNCQLFVGALPRAATGTLLNVDESETGSESEVEGQLEANLDFNQPLIENVELEKFTLGVYKNDIGKKKHTHTWVRVKVKMVDGDTKTFKFDDKRNTDQSKEEIVSIKLDRNNSRSAMLTARYICK